MKQNSYFKKGFDGVYKEEWENYNHKNLLSKKSLEELAKIIGYSKIIFNQRDQSISKLIPLEFRPAPDDFSRGANGNIFADLIK
ncbi:hypothetical protein GYA19_05520 [Candidatus Beckwithbacteria bacterium]|nr:hypothetical protein [Candidatus Beckwithbacteria bacterium]